VLAFAAQATATETIVIKGSDTLGAKMVPQLAEAFKATMAAQGIEVAFEIAAEGSSTGVASVIDGTAEIGMSSRDPKEKEIAKAKSKGVKMNTITMAKDGIAVVVNEANPLDSISLEEVALIFSGDVMDWSAISVQTGSISAYTRNTSSGTYAVFQKMAMSSRDYGDETQKMAGNEQIASEVANNVNGIGYIGLAYIDTPGVKVLPVEGVEPDAKGYPLARPLYYLTNGSKPLSPLTQQFVDFSLSPAGQEIVKRVHFLPVN
jgi:phosphate transport system substrate-binding protein